MINNRIENTSDIRKTEKLKKVLFFTPFTGIWPHALAEYQLRQLLDTSRFETISVSCHEALTGFCSVMESKKLKLESANEVKKKICMDCVNSSSQLARHEKGQWVGMNSYVRVGDSEVIESEIQKVNNANYIDYLFEGAPLGRIASYEPLIKYKKISLELQHHEFEYYKEQLRNSLTTHIIGQRVLEELKPDIVMCYSPQYTVTGTFAHLAKEMGIQVYFMEGSSNIAERYSSLRIWDWEVHQMVNPGMSHWNIGAADTLTENEIKRTNQHLKILRGKSSFSVYSPKHRGISTRKSFSIKPEQKILLAALSSYDEAFSAFIIGGFPLSKYKGSVFASQAEWIEATINWISNFPEFHLIIRLHPRDFPNKREGVHAEQLGIWSSILVDLPPNVSIDHPEEGFSLHDHFDEVDALVTGWSSTATEALLVGIPVVTYDSNMPSFPESIHYSGQSQTEYFANLKKALLTTRSTSLGDAASDWLAFSMSRGSVLLGGRVVDRHPFKKFPRLVKILVKFGTLVPFLRRSIDLSLPVCKNDSKRVNDLLWESNSSLYEV